MTVSAMLMRKFPAIASVVESEGIDAVAHKLAHHNIGAVVVLSTAGRLIGIITDGDLVRAFSQHKARLPALTAKDIMDANVHTCRPDETELEIMRVMTERRIRHMAVMMDESVVGIVTLDEAVRYRLQKIKELNEKAARETSNERRLAMVDQHMRESWNVFEVFRAVNVVQEKMGLARLDERSRMLLWLIGEGDNAGRPVQVKDLMAGRRWGSFPTVRKYLTELMERGLVEYVSATGGRGKPYQLTKRGQEVFAQMTKAVSETMLPLQTEAS